MEVNQLLTSPALKFLQAAPYLVYLMLLFHLPYMGLVLGSTILSISFHKKESTLSKDLINLVPTKAWLWIIFALLPAAALTLLYKSLLSGTAIPIYIYLPAIQGFQASGFMALFIYRRTGYFSACIAGAFLIAIYCFYFIDLTSLILFPEKWFFLKRPLPYPLFSITPFIDFIEFICLSFIVTGTFILFFYFQWPEKRLPGDTLFYTSYYTSLKNQGYGLILAGALTMPLVILWELLTLPGYALSVLSFIMAGVMILLSAVTAYTVVTLIMDKDESLKRLRQYSAPLFMASLLLFGSWIAKDGHLQANANRETTALLVAHALKIQADIISQREAQYAGSITGDEKLGEQIFNEKCSACHSFDQKVLGPPLNNVLSKYASKQDELEAFLRNPKKIDPRYPAMPKPGLNILQIKSVITFLMQKIGVTVTDEKTGTKEDQQKQPEMKDEHKNK